MAEPKESPSNNPGLQATPDEATKDYFMQQTVIHFFPFLFTSVWIIISLILLLFGVFSQMLRIKDPKASLDFYSRILGMS